MIEIRPGMYFVGIWQAAINGGDFMAAMWRNDQDHVWEAKYRFRYHKDDKVFNSQDTRKWYRLRSQDDSYTEKEKMKYALDQLMVAGEALGYMTDTSYTECEGDGAKMMELMSGPDMPTFHVRHAEREELRKYGIDPDTLKD